MKVLKIILGILAILAAPALMAFPLFTEVYFAYLAAIFAGIIGIISLVDYGINRKKREHSATEAAAGGLTVFAAILSIVIMIFNITIPGFTFTMEYIGVLFFLAYIFIDGISTIIGAFTYRNYSGGMKALTVIFGILITLAAIVGFACVPVIMAALGIFIGIGFILAGIGLILSAFSKEA